MNLPYGTDCNIKTPEIRLSPFNEVSPSDDQQGLRGFLGTQAGDVNLTHTDTGDKGGDDRHRPDEGNEGQ